MSITLVVEDGSGKTDSNVYDTQENVTAYWAQRGDTVWPGAQSDETLKAAMVRAATYIDTVYNLTFKGRRVTREQAMSWPRIGVVVGQSIDSNPYPVLTTDGFPISNHEVPREIKQAFYELSKRSLTDDLMPDVNPSEGAQIQTLTVGKFSQTWFQGGNRYKVYRFVTSILQDMLDGSSGNVPIERG